MTEACKECAFAMKHEAHFAARVHHHLLPAHAPSCYNDYPLARIMSHVDLPQGQVELHSLQLQCDVRMRRITPTTSIGTAPMDSDTHIQSFTLVCTSIMIPERPSLSSTAKATLLVALYYPAQATADERCSRGIRAGVCSLACSDIQFECRTHYTAEVMH